jgi:hypothetical protein
MDDVQNCDIYINIPSSQTYTSYPLNFLQNLISICYCRSQLYELCHIFKCSVKYLSLPSGNETPTYTRT